MQVQVYVVEGGWHAYDEDSRITAFGATKELAVAALREAVLRRQRLRAVGAAMGPKVVDS